MRQSISLLLLAALLALAGSAAAAAVRLSDGSLISGEVTQTEDAVTVTNAAGSTRIPRSKVAAIVEEASGGSAGTGSPYADQVLSRRARYGNEDGLPRTSNLMRNQLMVTLGQVNYVGDAYLIQDNAGKTLLAASDLGSLSLGLSYTRSFNDLVGWELWGDAATVSKDYSVGASTFSATLTRFGVGLGPRLQASIPLSGPESGVTLVPNLGLTPFYAHASGSTLNSAGDGSRSFSHSNLGASFNAGLDLQFGGALLGLKLRYLLSQDIDGGLRGSNSSAWSPQLALGWAFY